MKAGIDDFDVIWTVPEHGASAAVVKERLYHYRDDDGEPPMPADMRLSKADLEKASKTSGWGQRRARDPEIEKACRVAWQADVQGDGVKHRPRGLGRIGFQMLSWVKSKN